jgi:LPXTG-motif cell wall-anchored protein
MMKKIALALAAVAAMILGFGAVANAGTYPPGGQSVTVSSPTVGPGGTVTVTVNCTPGETVTATLGSATATAACGPDATAVLSISAPTTAGVFNGTVNGSVSGPLGSFTVTVQAAGTTPLPATGSDGTSTMTFLAAGLLVVGIGLFAVATIRRRRSPAAA